MAHLDERFITTSMPLDLSHDPNHNNHHTVPVTVTYDREQTNSADLALTKKPSLLKSAFKVATEETKKEQTVKEDVNRDQDTGGIIYVKYNVYWTNKLEGDTMYQVLIEFPGFTKVSDAIKPILREFNKKLIEQMRNFSLKDTPELYRLYSAKKTGKPKLDYPPLDNNQLLHQIGDKQFALVDTSAECVVTQMIQAEPPAAHAEDNSELQITMHSTNYEMGHPEVHRDDILKRQAFDIYEEHEEDPAEEQHGCCDALGRWFHSKKTKSPLEDARPPLLDHAL